MAHILIDGYNLTGIAHDNLEKVRNDLIEKLKKYSEIRNHHITLIFDGWKSGQKDQTEIKSRDLTVVYSRLGEKADLVIKRMVKASTVPWIVVSSDREISDFVEKNNSVAITSDEFERKLYSILNAGEQNTSGNPPVYDKDDNIDFLPSRQKGNPKQLSKTQKKKIAALKKL